MQNMGQQAFAQMKQSSRISSNTKHDAQVQCIARHVIGAADRVYAGSMPDRDWEVVVFEDPSPNAFALPGQKIGVHTGLIELADNPDQLAAVIGHEVGHVLSSHGNERMTQQLGVTIVLLAIGVLGEIDSILLMRALGLGAEVGLILPFSRAHESEADIQGLHIMAEAGFNPAESVELWRNMAELSGNRPMEFLSTHPGHETRIMDLQNSLRQVTRSPQRPNC